MTARIATTIALFALLGAACGGEPRRLEMKKIETAPAMQLGPKATPEEANGEVPPLQGLVKAIALVPDKLVPPEPPPDPAFEPAP
ncbi:MAG: hypothetical protein KC549_10765 [Myxococcales bacterium]|nr:hypothetical protein [Myxococcales bacterium]MCB9548723.1 hypothetical protein [Myxococcales bacterium]